MQLNCNDRHLIEEVEAGNLEIDDLTRALGHIANALEALGVDPSDYL